MIYTHEDFLEKLSVLYPEIEMKSLELITKRGLQGINKMMRDSQELIFTSFGDAGQEKNFVKFFTFMTPEKQHKHSMKNYYRKLRKREALENGGSEATNK